MFGPEPPPRSRSKPPARVVTINGENLTARQALERYPRLGGELQKDRGISEKSLHAKVRIWYRKNKITNEMLGLDPEIVPRKRGKLLGNNVIGHHTINSIGNTSPRDFLNYTGNTVVGFVNERRQNKVQLSLICIMKRVDPATGIVTNEEQVSFNSLHESIYGSTNLEEAYEKIIMKILESFATYLKNGSGWVLKKVVRLDITLSRLRPLRGCFYIPLPLRIMRKNALINLKNDDEECFKWHVTIGYFNLPDKYYPFGKVTKELRKYTEQLNWDGIEFPTPCSERVFKKFEKNNNVSLCVFGCEILPNKTNIPLYVS